MIFPVKKINFYTVKKGLFPDFYLKSALFALLGAINTPWVPLIPLGCH